MNYANNMQVGGSHYKSEYQHWDFVANALGYRYFEGNITKYVARARKKNGAQDLEKALHYLVKLQELCAGGMFDPLNMLGQRLTEKTKPKRSDYIRSECAKFAVANDLGEKEALIIERVATWETFEDLNAAHVVLVSLLAEVEGSAPGPGYVAQG